MLVPIVSDEDYEAAERWRKSMGARLEGPSHRGAGFDVVKVVLPNGRSRLGLMPTGLQGPAREEAFKRAVVDACQLFQE
jgi:hypothetical protein